MARNRGWSFLQSVLNGAFSTPGDGAIDYDAVLGALHDAGYQGWLVVEAEQDPAVAPSYITRRWRTSCCGARRGRSRTRMRARRARRGAAR